jgi:predicted DNA-binding mobile mystery protein A
MNRSYSWPAVDKAAKQLDSRLQDAAALHSRLTPPPKGWIRAIRESFGMTTSQLARRMDLTQATVTEMEKSEAKGGIRLSTLRRAAEAMNCTLVYALVPKEPISKIVRDRALEVAAKNLKSVDHTMSLEDQGLSAEQRYEQLSEYARQILNPRDLWDKP